MYFSSFRKFYGRGVKKRSRRPYGDRVRWSDDQIGVFLRVVLLSFCLCVLSACARERPPAPDDLDGMSHFLFVNWDDDKQLSAGMSALGPWLDTEGRTEESTSFGFVLTDLTPEEVTQTPHPDYDLSLLIGSRLRGLVLFLSKTMVH